MWVLIRSTLGRHLLMSTCNVHFGEVRKLFTLYPLWSRAMVIMIIMYPTSKKLEGHIAFWSFVHLFIMFFSWAGYLDNYRYLSKGLKTWWFYWNWRGDHLVNFWPKKKKKKKKNLINFVRVILFPFPTLALWGQSVLQTHFLFIFVIQCFVNSWLFTLTNNWNTAYSNLWRKQKLQADICK